MKRITVLLALLVLLVICVIFGVTTSRAAGYQPPMYPATDPEFSLVVIVSKEGAPAFPYTEEMLSRDLGWSEKPKLGGDEFFRSRPSLSVHKYLSPDSSVWIKAYPRTLFPYLRFREGNEVGGYMCISPSGIAEIKVLGVRSAPEGVEFVEPFFIDESTLHIFAASSGKWYWIEIRINLS